MSSCLSYLNLVHSMYATGIHVSPYGRNASVAPVGVMHAMCLPIMQA